MTLYNFGESNPYQASHPDFRGDTQKYNSQLSLHKESPDILLARKMADEIINISGGEVHVYIRTNNNDYDWVWDEDPDPTYWASSTLKACFTPQPIELELKKWGPDSENKTALFFSHRQLFELYNDRMLREGDVINVPYNSVVPNINPGYYRVTNGTPDGNFKYSWLYFKCDVEVLTGDITVRPHGDVPEDSYDSGSSYHEGY